MLKNQTLITQGVIQEYDLHYLKGGQWEGTQRKMQEEAEDITAQWKKTRQDMGRSQGNGSEREKSE